MGTDSGPRVGEVNPRDAWELLQASELSVLVDVRTHAEWSFVGVPDIGETGRSLILCEWSSFPSMSVNPDFAETVLKEVGDPLPETFLFLCRSGARSLKAAYAVADALAARGLAAACLNVAEGFEGDLDAEGHRAVRNGWKARGLAWRQS